MILLDERLTHTEYLCLTLSPEIIEILLIFTNSAPFNYFIGNFISLLGIIKTVKNKIILSVLSISVASETRKLVLK